MDSVTGELTGESFTLKYRDVSGALDFLVLRHQFDLAVTRLEAWRPGDRFRKVVIDDNPNIEDVWMEGTFLERRPYKRCPKSLIDCCCVK